MFGILFFTRRWLVAVGTISVVLLLSACASSNQKDESLLHLQLGTTYLQNSRYPDALRELLLAEKADANNAVIQNNLGLTYFIREKNDLAEQHLRRAIDLDSSYTEARNNYARVLIEQKKYDSAISELNKVLKDLTYNDAPKALTNLGLAYFRRGDYPKAKNFLSQALKLNRDNCLAYTLYGRSQLELNDFRNAANSLDSAVILCKSTEFDEPHYFAGIAYDRLGEKEKAIARLEEVVKLYPNGKYNHKAQTMLNEIGKQVQ